MIFIMFYGRGNQLPKSYRWPSVRTFHFPVLSHCRWSRCVNEPYTSSILWAPLWLRETQTFLRPLWLPRIWSSQKYGVWGLWGSRRRAWVWPLDLPTLSLLVHSSKFLRGTRGCETEMYPSKMYGYDFLWNCLNALECQIVWVVSILFYW